MDEEGIEEGPPPNALPVPPNELPVANPAAPYCDCTLCCGMVCVCCRLPRGVAMGEPPNIGIDADADADEPRRMPDLPFMELFPFMGLFPLMEVLAFMFEVLAHKPVGAPASNVLEELALISSTPVFWMDITPVFWIPH